MLDLKDLSISLINFNTEINIDIKKNRLVEHIDYILELIRDLLYLRYGSQQKKSKILQMEDRYEVLELKKELEKNLNRIPINKLKVPKMSIIGPAIEKSKYYVGEDIYRKMFAKLIASSIDSQKEPHHSFVNIIEQLSPLDAKNLLAFKINNNDENVNKKETIKEVDEYGNTTLIGHVNIPMNQLNTNIPNLNLHALPLVDVKYINKSGQIEQIYEDIFLSNLELENPKKRELYNIGISLSNLERLNLIKIEKNKKISNDKRYSKLKKYVEINFSSYNKLSKFDSIGSKSIIAKGESIKPKISKHMVRLTPYGLSFLNNCLE